ncbi:hypothetical protein Aab01nite_03700 [Paractinoplanes abujensis]|uniref:Uncharacterized protein n=1 Tax=Paractinoplanes abujensis TaxID=882441 RepID=A0A7W7CNG4_9ACTN|nr:hypothetical protein [Actinoplanes abujensis]GID16780.1 hypothetical protein Aab01nite_03700 [Actinoplanes abujensis]
MAYVRGGGEVFVQGGWQAVAGIEQDDVVDQVRGEPGDVDGDGGAEGVADEHDGGVEGFDDVVGVLFEGPGRVGGRVAVAAQVGAWMCRPCWRVGGSGGRGL